MIGSGHRTLALFAPTLFLTMVAGTYARAADLEAAKQKAEVCLTCHGPQGISSMPNIPNLAGQRDQYLQYQLVYFRNNQRKNELMQPQAAQLSDTDIRNLGALLAKLPAPEGAPGSDPDKALSEKGKKIAEQHRCAACHGGDFAGMQAAPRIAHQREDYLTKSLQDFRDHGRPSGGVGAMTEASAGLSDDDMRAVGHFLAHYDKGDAKP